MCPLECASRRCAACARAGRDAPAAGFSASLLLRLCAPLPRGALFLALRYLLASLRRLASSPRRRVAVPHRAFEHAASSSLYARLFLQTISDAGRDGLSPLTGT
ncbi:hypothetical protein DIS09_21265 [Burkholderia pseudomallei]|uniref:Uncharacterized protein n=1 Tax=Burkholderia pseudomallei TaxID=28450 RepID=A0AAX0U2S9_BURPE|nr:hypothetical protein EGY15_11255 [Burkholderia pseudomallei]MUU81496.1 hypothetical protein [Burkholderia pseudomallei]MVZ83945.1 hypothetical protein [Burkholderia pseudomallei]MWA20774.1 hypothetical protein [Burkholderia pseudomallei]MWA27682.1 hypothetical protein [Burkholderia pseudomallei]